MMCLTACTQETNAIESNNSEESVFITKRVSKEEFKSVLNENPTAQLVDVRTPNEYQAGKINEATNINFMDASFESKLQELDKSKLTLIYCQRGDQSAKH